MQENRETFPVVELQTVLEMPAGQIFRIFDESHPKILVSVGSRLFAVEKMESFFENMGNEPETVARTGIGVWSPQRPKVTIDIRLYEVQTGGRQGNTQMTITLYRDRW